jgi:hypothetical protein
MNFDIKVIIRKHPSVATYVEAEITKGGEPHGSLVGKEPTIAKSIEFVKELILGQFPNLTEGDFSVLV